MDTPTAVKPSATLLDYLAAERTLLAWIRTGLALMGFGFVVARFGLFLQQLQLLQHDSATHSYGSSLWFGTALIAVGVIVNISAGWHHIRLVRPSVAAELNNLNTLFWLSRLPSFWHCSGWRWRPIWFWSKVPLIRIPQAVRRYL